jgi:hypothetical protein
MKRVYFITDTNRPYICEQINASDVGYVVQIMEPTRSLEQNSLLWPLLECLAKQVTWYGQKLTSGEWKDVMTAALKKSKVVPGIEPGSFVVCGQSTSKMTKAYFSDLIELIYAFGAEQKPPVDFGRMPPTF